MKRLSMVAGAALLALAAARPAPDPEVLHLFLALDTPDAAKVVREARAASRIPLRAVFLLDRLPGPDFDPPPAFAAAVAELGQDLLVVDEEGLALARRFGVRATPCAVRTGRRVHKAVGTRIDWKELLSCE